MQVEGERKALEAERAKVRRLEAALKEQGGAAGSGAEGQAEKKGAGAEVSA